MAGLEVVPARLWRLGEHKIARKRHRVLCAPVVDDAITRALKFGLVIEDFESQVDTANTSEIGTSLAFLSERVGRINGGRVAVFPNVKTGYQRESRPVWILG
jgi:hypothetical protein